MKKQRGGTPQRRSPDNTSEMVRLLHESIWLNDAVLTKQILEQYPHLINREAEPDEDTIYGSERYTPIMTAIAAEDDHRSFKLLMEDEYVYKIDFMANNKNKINVIFLAIDTEIENVIIDLIYAEPRLLETKYKGRTPIQYIKDKLEEVGYGHSRDYLENTLQLIQSFYDMYHDNRGEPLKITRDGVPTRGLLWAAGLTREARTARRAERTRRRISRAETRETSRRERSQSPRRRATVRRARSQSPRRRPARVNTTRNARSNSVGRRTARTR